MIKFVSCRCPNCGSNLKVKDKEEKVTCKYCNTEFFIEEDIDYEIKKTVNNNLKVGSKVAAGIFIVWGVMFLFILSIITFVVICIIKGNDESGEAFKNIHIGFIEREKAENFNFFLEHENGTQNAFFVKDLLDKIITSNKKNKNHQIKVIYKDISTTDSEQIKELKNDLKTKDYEISFDYDKYGYINVMTIEEIND